MEEEIDELDEGLTIDDVALCIELDTNAFIDEMIDKKLYPKEMVLKEMEDAVRQLRWVDDVESGKIKLPPASKKEQ